MGKCNFEWPLTNFCGVSISYFKNGSFPVIIFLNISSSGFFYFSSILTKLDLLLDWLACPCDGLCNCLIGEPILFLFWESSISLSLIGSVTFLFNSYVPTSKSRGFTCWLEWVLLILGVTKLHVLHSDLINEVGVCVLLLILLGGSAAWWTLWLRIAGRLSLI